MLCWDMGPPCVSPKLDGHGRPSGRLGNTTGWVSSGSVATIAGSTRRARDRSGWYRGLAVLLADDHAGAAGIDVSCAALKLRGIWALNLAAISAAPARSV